MDPQPSGSNPAHEAIQAVIRDQTMTLIQAATIAIGGGSQTFAMVAARPKHCPEMAAMVVVISGKMSDDDLRRAREYLRGFNQDASQGARPIDGKIFVDKLGPGGGE